MSTHVHLDLVGGISGDMFIGAMLDAFPAEGEGLAAVIEAAGFPDLVNLDLSAFNDGILTGSKFHVEATRKEAGHHHHRHYSEIRQRLNHSSLSDRTRDIAQDMFLRIAEAEASIHGKQVDDVAFHEIGAWDSIADVVLAAHMIETSGATSWSISAIPTGKGRVMTAHGELPIPAPATSLLLRGFELVDDGVEGERVTPTGAAIISHLAPAAIIPKGKLLGVGYGFGTKRFEGFSNVLRVSVYDLAEKQDNVWDEDEVLQLSFEIDDQTAEDLSAGLDLIRNLDGVIDVRTDTYAGKKSRLGVAVTVLARPEAKETALAACFSHTTTLGIRQETIRRAILERKEYAIEAEGKRYNVKVVRRPQGLTAKADIDGLMGDNLGAAGRTALRAELEAQALKLAREDFD